MILRGSVQHGVIVLDKGSQLPEGTRVDVIPAETSAAPGDKAELSPAEHRRVSELLDRIAALPIEGGTEPFSGADHDQALYGTA